MEKLSIKDLNGMKPFQVLEDERVKDRFLHLCKSRNVGDEEAESFWETEKYNFARIIQNDDNLKQCTGFSIYGCICDIAVMGLSLDNASQPLLYVLWGNVKNGQNWEKRAKLEISPYGELALRMQTGQLIYADRPVVVYKGDKFKPIVNEKGQKICLYEASVPRQSNEIIASFIRLTRPDGSFDFYYMLPEDIERLKGYSTKKNKGKTNALYTSNGGQIDTGFLEAKTIKHAFKTFPKIKIAVKFSKLQEEEVQPIDYGLDEEVKPGMTDTGQPNTPVMEQEPQQPDNDPFGGAPVDQPQGVQVEDDDDVF